MGSENDLFEVDLGDIDFSHIREARKRRTLRRTAQETASSEDEGNQYDISDEQRSIAEYIKRAKYHRYIFGRFDDHCIDDVRENLNLAINLGSKEAAAMLKQLDLELIEPEYYCGYRYAYGDTDIKCDPHSAFALLDNGWRYNDDRRCGYELGNLHMRTADEFPENAYIAQEYYKDAASKGHIRAAIKYVAYTIYHGICGLLGMIFGNNNNPQDDGDFLSREGVPPLHTGPAWIIDDEEPGFGAGLEPIHEFEPLHAPNEPPKTQLNMYKAMQKAFGVTGNADKDRPTGRSKRLKPKQD